MNITLERILQCIGTRHGAAKELADALGINPQIITNWKCGNSRSYRNYIPEIAEHFGVSVDYLLGNEEKPAAPKDDEPEVKETLTDMAKRAAEGALLMYDGEPLDAETQRAFEASLRVVIATLEGRRGK